MVHEMRSPDRADTPEVKVRSADSQTVRAAADVLSGTSKRGVLATIMPFLGPAFVAAVAYVDPGNFATNIAGGARYGYMLLWVIMASNIMAMIIQMLSAKLGIATGKNLAEHCRDRWPKAVVLVMWFAGEMVAIATDLAEFLGAAVGFALIFGTPLIWGGILTAVATFAILAFEKRGFRPLEAVIAAMVGIIAVCYVIETVLGRPDWGAIAYHAVVPRLQGPDSIMLASGILGATVMPHVIFLHSALTSGRIVTRDPVQIRRLMRFELIDVIIALGIAGMINAAMLIMAAKVFHGTGHTGVGTIEEAHRTLKPLLGNASSVVFGISLLASGLSSSAVGTMSGQIIMQGFLHREIPLWVRRGVTMAPSLLVIMIGMEPTRVLVFSQVLLSFGIPFALVPLIQFTSDRRLMGVLVNSKLTTAVASVIAALIIGLNVFLLYQTFLGG
jgi:manganese transport protein